MNTTEQIKKYLNETLEMIKNKKSDTADGMRKLAKNVLMIIEMSESYEETLLSMIEEQKTILAGDKKPRKRRTKKEIEADKAQEKTEPTKNTKNVWRCKRGHYFDFPKDGKCPECRTKDIENNPDFISI